MSTIVNRNGNDIFYHGSSLFMSPGHHRQGDVYSPPCKRSRIVVPFGCLGDCLEETQRVSIELLPDECLFEIFRRLPGGGEKSACAGVSKRWLTLLSGICRDEVMREGGAGSEGQEDESESEGFLSRCLEGEKATDVRLAAIAVGSGSRGGLGKLLFRGGSGSSVRKITDSGLEAISRGCPSLKVLSLWDVPSVGDEGLSAIANGCALLEKLDLSHCPGVTDQALISIAKSCPNLSALSIESCTNIGNESLQAISSHCLNLKSISIKDCPLVGDQGIASLFSAESQTLTKVKLQSLNITDLSLAVIGHYGKMVTDLFISGLQTVNEKGFWVMGSCQGLQMLKSLTIASCRGVTDLGLAAIGMGCSNLRQLCLRKCALLSDNGLISFAEAAGALESLQLEECHRITEFGILSSVRNLKALSVVRCFGIKDVSLGSVAVSPRESIKSVSVQNCPGFGDACLAFLGKLCPQLQHLNLKNLEEVTDAGFLAFLQSNEAGLVKVNLSGCGNLTDESVIPMIKSCGSTLEVLTLDGCNRITDASLAVVANNCFFLSDLDLSAGAITDHGLAILAGAKQLNLQILSISCCSSISNKSVTSLLELGRTLIGLNIQHCNSITSGKVDKLVEQLWRCDILY
uniref:F-box/LRR-repeat protein 15-like leucin rich repeat domain-containing protein n=1 Tax=Kalanchoe fedtschenkoi TaxID=63787 RepID=A0A7N0URV5_KALFE